ncbi:MAG: histidine phosphatase family protein [Gemmatimonadetes bacterium]|nr:MAG: histidine phosphatase family protein [Gemmatimonadota bacterium]
MRLAIRAAALALAVSAWPASAAGQTDGEPVVIYLVRHAEVAPDGTRDPALSERGRERAAALARVLGEAGLGRVLSTDLRRTRQTAAPIAEDLGVEVESYDPRALPELAAALRAAGGRILVVGHSNTTPALVAALGGDPGEPIDESVEYDRLYQLVLLGDGRVLTTVLRYGG